MEVEWPQVYEEIRTDCVGGGMWIISVEARWWESWMRGQKWNEREWN